MVASTPIASRRLVAAVALMVVGLGVGPIFPVPRWPLRMPRARGQLGAVSGGVAFSRALGGAIGVAAASGPGTRSRRRRAHFGRTDHEPRRPGARTDLSPEARLRSRPCVRRHVRRGRGGAGDQACGLRARRGSAARRALALAAPARVNGGTGRARELSTLRDAYFAS